MLIYVDILKMRMCSPQIGKKPFIVVFICLCIITSFLSFPSVINLVNERLGMFKIAWQRSKEVSVRKSQHVYDVPNYTADMSKKLKGGSSMNNESRGRKVSKLILLKNNPPWPLASFLVKDLALCSVNCTLLTSGSDLSMFDAILFNAVYFQEDPPPRTVPGQVWIFFSLESPNFSADSGFRSPGWRNMINWTLTYRLDSDIWYPYARILKKEKSENFDFLELTKTKTKTIAWFVSHCGTPSERQRYVDELKKYISVDIFGLCGTHKCPQSKSVYCTKMLSRKYKFYLSFENTFCYDYITEKAFQYMNADVIIVVRGGANYTQFFPPKSYINTADFKSPKHLAEYLLYLDKNRTAYVEYLQWKNHYYISGKRFSSCKLCEKLYNPTAHAKVYKDIYSWWHEDACFSPNDLSF